MALESSEFNVVAALVFDPEMERIAVRADGRAFPLRFPMRRRFYPEVREVLNIIRNETGADCIILRCLDDGDSERGRPRVYTALANGGELRSGRQLQYLGLVFNGTDVVIRSSSIHRYHRKLKKGLRAAVHRQRLESCASGMDAPLRRQALYNMYSELPVRGEKVRQRQNRLKHSGNFIRYLDRAVSRLGADLGADRIKRQRRKLLRHFRRKLRERL